VLLAMMFRGKRAGSPMTAVSRTTLRVPSFFFNLYEAHECLDGLWRCIFRATTAPTVAKKAALKKLNGIMPEYLNWSTLNSEAPPNRPRLSQPFADDGSLADFQATQETGAAR
jgi:hypothetical protein